MCNHMERLVVDGHVLAGSDHAEVLHYVIDRDPVEVVSLTARQDGRKNLMLFSSRKDEYSMCRRFLEGLEEGIEGSLRKHVDLVDDVHAVLSDLRRYAHLVHQGLDILHSVVGSGIKFMDAV